MLLPQQSTNWWWNELDVPRELAEIILLFQFNATATELAQANVIMNRYGVDLATLL